MQLEIQTFTECVELALIPIWGEVADSAFARGAWEGVVEFANKIGVRCGVYSPNELSVQGHLEAIETAVKKGAKIIITPGHRFAVPIYRAQNCYPDTKFILLGGGPHNADGTDKTIGKNTIGIDYAEEQAGFLAGYATVKDGMTRLGFLGGFPFPAILRFGYGYIQGAEYAASELELGVGAVTVEYCCIGEIDASPRVQAIAESLYQKGTEVIFGCGGSLCDSIMLAAEQCGGKVIGVDTDQAQDSEAVVTSALKNLSGSVYNAISDCYSETFRGGKVVSYNAKNNGICISIETSRFKAFSRADYDNIYRRLADDSISVLKDTDNGGLAIDLRDIPTRCVNVIVTENK